MQFCLIILIMYMIPLNTASIDSSLGLETRVMHTHFIWSVWDVDLLPLEDQAKSFASVMQVGQEAECHMNPHINMVILKLYIWRLTRPLDWWMQYLAGRHHMCDLWQRDPEQCWFSWLFHSVPGATWAAYSQSEDVRSWPGRDWQTAEWLWNQIEIKLLLD